MDMLNSAVGSSLHSIPYVLELAHLRIAATSIGLSKCWVCCDASYASTPHSALTGPSPPFVGPQLFIAYVHAHTQHLKSDLSPEYDMVIVLAFAPRLAQASPRFCLA